MMKKRVAALLVALAVAGGGATYLSQTAVQDIASHEGLRLAAYPDPATKGDPWTICWGHTGPEVRRGLVVSIAQCERWFAQDLRIAERAVQRNIRVPIRQGQYDAYVSFVFNVGESRFRTSTMLRLVNSGHWHLSCREFPKWKYANKMVLEGLVVRRYREQKICLAYGEYVYVPKNK